MTRVITFLTLLAILVFTSQAHSQELARHADIPDLSGAGPVQPCPPDKVCVSKVDMLAIVQVLRERQCLLDQDPVFDLDDVKIFIDEDNRVFYSGKGPKSPYKLTMSWCHLHIEATGDVEVVAALKEPPVWGFRFRPKAYMGYALLTPLFGHSISEGTDAGLMLDFLHYKWANLNAAVGFRTFGAGLGVDLTTNFGAYAGYGVTWGSILNPTQQPLHNVVVGVDFAF